MMMQLENKDGKRVLGTLYSVHCNIRGQGSLVVRVLGSCHSIPGSILAWEFDLMGLLIYRLEYLLSYWTTLSIMCGLHDVTPSLNECMSP